MSETFKKSQMSDFFDVSAGWISPNLNLSSCFGFKPEVIIFSIQLKFIFKKVKNSNIANFVNYGKK